MNFRFNPDSKLSIGISGKNNPAFEYVKELREVLQWRDKEFSKDLIAGTKENVRIKNEGKQGDPEIEDPYYIGQRTFNALRRFQEEYHIAQAGEKLGQATAVRLNEIKEQKHINEGGFLVKGQLKDEHGNPLSGYTVYAEQVTIADGKTPSRHEVQTDINGWYSIPYLPQKEVDSVHIPVRVGVHSKVSRSASLPDSIAQQEESTRFISQAKHLEEVNLTYTPVKGCEFACMQESLIEGFQALGHTVPQDSGKKQVDAIIDMVAELSQDKVSILSEQTGVGPEQILALQHVGKVAKDYKGIDSGLLYGIVRQAPDQDVDAVFAQGPQAVKDAVQTALSEGIIAQKEGDEINKINIDKVSLAKAEASPWGEI